MSIQIKGAVTVDRRWQSFKPLFDGAEKSLSLQYEQDDDSYSVFSVDGPVLYTSTVYKAGFEPKFWSKIQRDQNAVDLAELLALPAPMQIVPAIQSVEVGIRIGGMDKAQDGGAVLAPASSWAVVEWTLAEPLHLTGALVCWDGWKAGDYGFACVLNPMAAGSLTVQAVAGQADLDIGSPALAAAYDPAVNGGKDVWVELWTENAGAKVDLLERRKVLSVVGQIVTLAESLSQTHLIGAITIPVYGLYSSPRGPDKLDGGIFMVGSGSHMLGNPTQQQASSPIPAGMCVCIRLRTTPEIGTRACACTFLMWRPLS